MDMSLHFIIVTILTALILAYAGLRGGAPERSAAAIVAARYLIDPIYHWAIADATFCVMDVGDAVMDGMVLAAFIRLALISNRVWPVWMAASTFIAVLGHLIMLAGKDGMQGAYWAMTNIPHFVQLFIVLAGTVFHRLRVQTIGPYPDWR